MKGIGTCEDCDFEITIYRFTGSQGLFSIPKAWCEECDLLVSQVRRTVTELGLDDKTKITIRPWWLWFWQPLLTHLAWHAPILTINGKLISQGVLPTRQLLMKALTRQIVSQTTEF